EPEHEALAITQTVIHDSIEATGEIDTDKIAEKVFTNNISAKQEYTEKVTEKAIPKTVAVPNTTKYEKKYRVQKFKLDSGIELSIPIDIYQDHSKVEFVNNADGTMSLVLKDIASIVNKFSV
ncbi:nucleoid-associated protein, partial [Leuconostoc falkenbergense]